MTDGPGIMTGIHPGGDENSVSGNLSAGFMVDDFEESEALPHKINITITHMEDDGKSANYIHFTDTDGTTLYFVKPKRE